MSGEKLGCAQGPLLLLDVYIYMYIYIYICIYVCICSSAPSFLAKGTPVTFFISQA